MSRLTTAALSLILALVASAAVIGDTSSSGSGSGFPGRPWNSTLDPYLEPSLQSTGYNATTSEGRGPLVDSANLDELFFARTPTAQKDTRPTPAPTGHSSILTTVHITSEGDFALLLPKDGELISDAENDGSAYCTPTSDGTYCRRRFAAGLIRAAAVEKAGDGSWIQVTGCLDSSKYPFASSDDGGQFDVRFPNGAQCAFGGYGASFVEQVEPSANRFCLRCCAAANDQENCNSHQDRAGCPVAFPGKYDFPQLGVDCS